MVNIEELKRAVLRINSMPVSDELKEAVDKIWEVQPHGLQTKSRDNNSRRPSREDLDDAVNSLETAIEKIEPEYQQPVFQCYSDYKKCCRENHKYNCAPLLVICLAQQLMPFVK